MFQYSHIATVTSAQAVGYLCPDRVVSISYIIAAPYVFIAYKHHLRIRFTQDERSDPGTAFVDAKSTVTSDTKLVPVVVSPEDRSKIDCMVGICGISIVDRTLHAISATCLYPTGVQVCIGSIILEAVDHLLFHCLALTEFIYLTDGHRHRSVSPGRTTISGKIDTSVITGPKCSVDRRVSQIMTVGVNLFHTAPAIPVRVDRPGGSAISRFPDVNTTYENRFGICRIGSNSQVVPSLSAGS